MIKKSHEEKKSSFQFSNQKKHREKKTETNNTQNKRKLSVKCGNKEHFSRQDPFLPSSHSNNS